MKRNFTLVFLLLQTMFLSLSAQTVLTRSANELQLGDELTLTRIDTISPGNVGPNQLWDFSTAKTYEDYVIDFNADASKTNNSFSKYIASNENNERTSYFQTTPTQRLYFGTSTDKGVIKFDQPLVEMTYPFAYGSEVKGAMNGTFTKNDFTVPITGAYVAKADAWGTLILPNGVKLNNVLRITSIREYDQESSGSDYHFTIKRYAFYAPGSRYAVLQIKDVVYDCINCACDGTEYKAYFNAGVKSELKDEEVSTAHFKYKVYPNPFESVLKIDYSIEATANIRMSLVDLMGREVKVLLNKTQDAGVYSITTDMSGYHASNFVLRMQVNDILYTEVLIKKERCSKR
jgi:hypothetical protein